MELTPYHARYFAHELTKRSSSASVDSLTSALADAQVDLNPHQVDAALFAVRSPFSQGVILADEVGLGKTIEASLVLAQKWAGRRRRILLILPATLRKQWQQELQDKFGLPSLILEGKSYTELRSAGGINPFEQTDRVVICSYHFAASRALDVARVPWDLVIIDEAHRLRNVYRPSSKIARAIADAVRTPQKVLLTATPLQNSLLELFGLLSIIDDHVFGDEASFKEQFMRFGPGLNESSRNTELKQRLAPVLTRTLRRQVLEYIRFTQRMPLTQDFTPSTAEQELYDQVSAYLQRQVLHALPSSQRALITMVLRKLLASSSFAIAGTLRRMTERLERMQQASQPVDEDEYEALAEIQDEWDEPSAAAPPQPAATTDLQALHDELEELRGYAEKAEGIRQNSKGDALLLALKTALDRAVGLGAARKAVIFTESRRTQQYLHDLLSANGYAGQMVLINGGNSDPESRAVYARWLERHHGSDAVSGSRSADMKAALVEEFRDHSTLLIATESAAEGVNLQFCSLVVNYDLPWNPQRIEQRIGRCHRYGQQHDVVVVNFLNRSNAADQRVFQLLSEKFRLFDGVFGASDEVLGAVESGVDLERRIAQVYQEARTPNEIQLAFDDLQAELDEQIQSRMSETRQLVMEHFDEEIQERLAVHRDEAQASLNERQRWLRALTQFELGEAASFARREPYFDYAGGLAASGTYHFDWRAAEARDAFFYSQEHELAQALIRGATERALEPACLRLDYRAHGAPIGALLPLLGQSGWLDVSELHVQSVGASEFMVLVGRTDNGDTLDDDLCQKLLSLPATVDGPLGSELSEDVDSLRLTRADELRSEVASRNTAYFDEETAKLDRWADDLKSTLEHDLRDIERQIREARRAAIGAVTLAEKLEAQKQVRDLEARRSKKRRELYEDQDRVEQQRDELINNIEKQLEQHSSIEALFTIRWTLVG